MASPVHQLFEEITALLFEGLRLEPALCRSIESLYGGLDAAAFGNGLEQTEDPETASLIALVFSPDESFQRHLEPAIERFSYTLEDRNDLTELIRCRQPRTRLFIDKGRTFEVLFPKAAAASFVAGLHIDVQLPMPFRKIVDRNWAQPIRSGLKVAVRNSRLRLSANQAKVLDRLVENASADHVMADVNFLLDTYMAYPEGDPPALLFDLQNRLTDLYRNCMEWNSQDADKAAELRILSGVRRPHVHPMEIVAQMNSIDRILEIITALGR